mgnify:FL=1
MYLQYDYQMRIRYSAPVEKCFYTIKCIPKTTMRQKATETIIQMSPQSDWSYGEDGWKNKTIYGNIQKAHDTFEFRVHGKVEIQPSKYEEKADRYQIGMYCYPFGKCCPGDGLRQYFASADLTGCGSALEKSIRIMHDLYQHFSYVSHQTGVSTSAEEAWHMGMGVCQDYAHIFIVLLRLAGIPARYVCGLLAGEGASHAWVEAFCEGRWIGLDPTNDCCVGNSHIKLGDGRDASECAINRGILIGGGIQQQDVCAVVKQII